jgi:methylated-DNA-[protein]-cysteine S-methyltransferase
VNTCTLPTPAGPLTILATDDGTVRAAGFTAVTGDLLRLLPAGWRDEPRLRPDLGDVTKAVAAYLAGDLTALDQVPVEHPAIGAFLPRAWEELRRIRPGEVISYTELAARSGNPAAVRAAANACARNAAAAFVPCHRVRRTDGTLGGYRWGLPVKRWLLSHERGVPAR